MKQIAIMIIRGSKKEELSYWAGKNHALPVGGINLQEESK